jgi:hypothetical protein
LLLAVCAIGREIELDDADSNDDGELVEADEVDVEDCEEDKEKSEDGEEDDAEDEDDEGLALSRKARRKIKISAWWSTPLENCNSGS